MAMYDLLVLTCPECHTENEGVQSSVLDGGHMNTYYVHDAPPAILSDVANRAEVYDCPHCGTKFILEFWFNVRTKKLPKLGDS